MKNIRNQKQRGVALLFALLALLLLSAIAAGLVFATNTESGINSNYRSEQLAYFAARAGLEEARERIMTNSPNAIVRPTLLPGATNGAVTYIVNPAGAADVVQPWTTNNKYFDGELCKENFYNAPNPAANPGAGQPCPKAVPGNGYSVNAASDSPFTNSVAAVPYKWVRITLKENGTPQPYCVDGACAAGTLNTEVCWDGGKQLLAPGGQTCNNAGFENVYVLTSFAQTASGTRRMLSMETAPGVSFKPQAAIYSQDTPGQGSSSGDALNVTGNASPWCNKPSTYGAKSGNNTFTPPGSGNVTGSPGAIQNNAGFPYNLSTNPTDPTSIINILGANAKPITDPATGVTTVAGTPPTYTGPSAQLGTPPTVNPSTGPVSSVSGGTPITYISQGNLTLGGPAGAGVSGYGILLVKGNLILDVSSGFNYYGLIIATGDVTMTAAAGTAVNPQVHGAMLVGGHFNAPISNMSGSVSIFQDACMIDRALGPQPLKELALHELPF